MIGSATFITTIGTSVAMTFLNRELATFGGTAAITSMGAINSLYTLFIMPIMGITQGMQPIIGYNYGAKEKERVNRTLLLGMLRQFVFLLPLLLILPDFIGLNGVWLATPIADGLAVLVTIIVLLREFRKEETNTNIDKKSFYFFDQVSRLFLSRIYGLVKSLLG